MDIGNYIKLDRPLYAHIKDGRKELLQEHSSLSLKYFEKIIEEKKLKQPIEETIREFLYCKDKDKKGNGKIIEFVYSLLRHMVVLHDSGKINPLFQRKLMLNSSDTRAAYSNVSGTDHSLLSSVIYVDRMMKLIRDKELGADRMLEKKLKGIIAVNGYIISRHHSDLGDSGVYFEKFIEGREAYIMIPDLDCDKEVLGGLKFLTEKNVMHCAKHYKKALSETSREQKIAIFIYARLAYSLLVASDYYATTEFMSGLSVEQLDNISSPEHMKDEFEKNELLKAIRSYGEKDYYKEDSLENIDDINILRSELFLEAEKILEVHKDKDIFFLEAPTGSGKSNTAVNLSLKMLDKKIRKIFYIYPFNTLVEQNIESLKKSFNYDEDTISQIAVINSIEPIKLKEKYNIGDNLTAYYEKALLDRQFLNYPVILSTHVSLFRTMFGKRREDIFAFFQLANSVIVLDEIQNYRNDLWAEIIIFLQAYAKLLNIKVIIMSATLPKLGYLSDQRMNEISLIEDRDKYFNHDLFKNRVSVSYELMEASYSFDSMFNHMEKYIGKKRILVEFISKKSAIRFYDFIKIQKNNGAQVLLFTGDDNMTERKRILKLLHESTSNIILVATQVVEAGVDIDMDVGYKDISKLDSEEQFMGRINRSCLKGIGRVFFFNCDNASSIYKNDIRVSKELTLEKDDIKSILTNKQFDIYYQKIMNLLKKRNESMNERGLECFFGDKVGKLNFIEVDKRMKLIDDKTYKISVFFNTQIDIDGKLICGSDVWLSYKGLLSDSSMSYSEKTIKLSIIRSKMNNFIYEISVSNELVFDDMIGELGYVNNGEEYLIDGKLNYNKILEGNLFI